MNEINILIDISKRLNDIEVPYMLTGSLAMNYYAEPRMTRDIDLVVLIQNRKINSLINKFENDYYISKNAVKKAVNNSTMFNIIHNKSVIKADFIIRKNSEYRKEEFKRRKAIRLKGETLYIVAKEDLIISKLNWARDSNSELQRKDIINLLETKYDQEYLENWLINLDLYNCFEEFVGAGYL